jgi:Leucine-rich repeat (LRR) protein
MTTSSANEMAETSRRRRWYQISLRALLVTFTLAALAIGMFVRHVNRRQAAIDAIKSAGGLVEGAPPQGFLQRCFEVLAPVSSVELDKGRANNALLGHVAALGDIPSLVVLGGNVDDEGVRLIARMPIQSLCLQSTKISDQSAALLSEMKTLTYLDLNNTNLSDQFLEQLESLPKLRYLGLRESKVTDVGMKYLSRYPQLRRLDVYYTDVGDEGVESLAACQLLEDLGLSITKVTEGIFEQLDRLPNLQSVELCGNSLEKSSVVAFEHAHPSCDIDY